MLTAPVDAADIGRPVTLEPGVRRLTAGNPGPMTGPGTNTYLVGTREVVILDPGPALPDHVAAILAAVAGARVVAIAVTHSHRDHAAGIGALRAACPAPVVGACARHRADHDPDYAPSALAGPGTVLSSDAGELVAVPTPGHASNHLCWHQPAARLLYTGDHILGTTSPVILPPDGDMTEYLASLQRVAALPLDWLLPGHGPVLADPVAVCAALVRHRLAREARVLEALAAVDRATLAALVPRVYTDVDPSLHGWAARTLEAHLLRLQALGRVRRVGDAWASR